MLAERIQRQEKMWTTSIKMMTKKMRRYKPAPTCMAPTAFLDLCMNLNTLKSCMRRRSLMILMSLARDFTLPFYAERIKSNGMMDVKSITNHPFK